MFGEDISHIHDLYDRTNTELILSNTELNNTRQKSLLKIITNNYLNPAFIHHSKLYIYCPAYEGV